jgi:hypothetical protein
MASKSSERRFLGHAQGSESTPGAINDIRSADRTKKSKREALRKLFKSPAAESCEKNVSKEQKIAEPAISLEGDHIVHS